MLSPNDKTNFETLKSVYLELEFDNICVFYVAVNLYNECLKLGIDIIISKTGDREILIYKKQNDGGITNLLIDEDGDVSYLYIGDIRQKPKVFLKEDGLNYSEISKLLLNYGR